MSFILILVLPFLLLTSAVSDFCTMRIPNFASIALLGVFPFVIYYFDISAYTVILHLAAGFIILLPGFLLYLVDQVGAGDVKLLSTSALWFGLTPSLLEYIVLVSIFGAILAVIMFVVRFFFTNNMIMNTFLPTYVFHGKKVPYGIAICLAGLITFPNTEIMKLAIERIAAQ